MSEVVSNNMDREFNTKAYFVRYNKETEGYQVEDWVLTSRRGVIEKLCATQPNSVYSLHLGHGVTIFANADNFLQLGFMTANVTDALGTVWFWGGDFVVCKDNGAIPIDADQNTLLEAIKKIKGVCIKSLKASLLGNISEDD